MNTFEGNVRRIIKTRMQRAALNSRRLGELTGMDERYIRLLLDGSRALTVRMLNRLAPHLDTTPNRIYQEAREMENDE